MGNAKGRFKEKEKREMHDHERLKDYK